MGRQAVIEVVPEQPGDVDRTCADITKAKTLLGIASACSIGVIVSPVLTQPDLCQDTTRRCRSRRASL